jgi:hypothetical protein
MNPNYQSFAEVEIGMAIKSLGKEYSEPQDGAEELIDNEEGIKKPLVLD